MKNYIFALLISGVFAANAFSQADTQDSASDAQFIPESIERETSNGLASVIEAPGGECVESFFQPAEFSYGMIPQQVGNSGFFPAYSSNCATVGPVMYQENFEAPISQRYAVPTQIANPSGFNSFSGTIRQPSTSNMNGQLNPISQPELLGGNQYTPIIQPNNIGTGQTTGRLISSPALPNYNSVITDRGSSAVSLPLPENNFAQPIEGAIYNPLQIDNCCPTSRGFGARGRFFRRYR